MAVPEDSTELLHQPQKAFSGPSITHFHPRHYRISLKQVYIAIALKANGTESATLQLLPFSPAGPDGTAQTVSTISLCRSSLHTHFQFLLLVQTSPFSC